MEQNKLIVSEEKLHVMYTEKDYIKLQNKIGPRNFVWARAAVMDGKDDIVIAERLQSDVELVAAWIAWRGWRGERDIDAEDARRGKQMLNTWRQAVSIKAQSVSLAALQMAEDVCEAGDAKALANAARGAASLVSLARQAEGMDARGGMDTAMQVNLSVFYYPSPAPKEEPLNVTPIEDTKELF